MLGLGGAGLSVVAAVVQLQQQWLEKCSGAAAARNCSACCDT
jgi:hypothetical protein